MSKLISIESLTEGALPGDLLLGEIQRAFANDKQWIRELTQIPGWKTNVIRIRFLRTPEDTDLPEDTELVELRRLISQRKAKIVIDDGSGGVFVSVLAFS